MRAYGERHGDAWLEGDVVRWAWGGRKPFIAIRRMLKRRARRVGRALAAFAILLCLLLPSPAHAKRTQLTREQVASALALAHVDVFGESAPDARLLMARAQVGLEVGHGRWAYCNNLGNIGAKRSRKVPSCVTKGGFRVRAYASPRAAARAYWRLASVRKALPWFDRGDPVGAAYALKRGGYYTAPAEVYAARMAAVHRDLSRGVVRKKKR